MRKKAVRSNLSTPITRALEPSRGAARTLPTAAFVARALAGIGGAIVGSALACSKHEAPTHDTVSTNASASTSTSTSSSVVASDSASAVPSSSSSIVAAVASCSATEHVLPHVPPGKIIGLDGTTNFPQHLGGAAPAINPVVVGAPKPRVGESGVSVSGGVAPDDVKKVVRAGYALFRTCYAKGLAGNPSLHGVVSTSFKIVDGGVVTPTTSSSLGNSAVEACVRAGFASLAFPSAGSPTNVVYPLVFTSSSSA
jgi:hypothetical protein